ncbi:MAG TPA: hypothetical protein VFV87_22680 [Pirellulaceae bacterium]|nr:hypothetical protein [Pirellulaceae bacterium]
MDKRITLIAGLTALFAVGSVHAATCPVPAPSEVTTAINDETGHTFFLYASPGITWDQAQACVSALPQQSGVPAHLATITSSSENQWIVDVLLLNNVGAPRMALTQVWGGGSQGAGAAEPREGWRWVNNEGPIPVPGSTVTLGYSNWSPAPNLEPNNQGGNEEQLTLGRYSADLGRWNDEGSAPGSIGGFIVEYDTPRTSTAGCTPSGTSTVCTTVEGQSLTFPPGTFTNNSSITFTAFEFTDPRVDTSGRCVGIGGVRGPLTLFDDPAFNLPGGASGKLVIPSHLCGSPKFVVVRAVGTNITIPRGVVVTESETSIILPDNIYDCNNPIPAGGSPQQQDVGAWQSLDAREMWESHPTVPDSRFDDGTAAELTTACASTLIKTRAKSNFVSGLHVDFGPAFAFGSAAEYFQVIAWTQYKISLVRQSVVDARAKGRISNANGQAMLSLLDAAAAALTANNPVGAKKKIEDFLKKVNSSTYSTSLTDPFNYNGDHLARGENIRFTLIHKAIPFMP